MLCVLVTLHWIIKLCNYNSMELGNFNWLCKRIEKRRKSQDFDSTDSFSLWESMDHILNHLICCLFQNQPLTDQKQPFRGGLRKRCSENMQQICWRKPIQKCDFNKVSKQLCWNHSSRWVFSCKFTEHFQSTFF